MNIAIFGASGPTGILLVQQALEQEHQVTALVRNPDKLTLTHPNLKIVKGDVFSGPSFENILSGQDIVLSALGATQMGATTIYTEGGKNIIEAMRKNNVKRFICMTSAGVEEQDPSFPFIYKLMIKPMLRKIYADAIVFEKQLQSIKDIDWTIVRPTALNNKPITRNYRVSPRFSPKGGAKISRADVAHFIMEEVNQNKWIGKTPTLAY